MPKSIVDRRKILELLERGVENIYPSKQYVKSLLEGKKQLTVYLGIDPSASVLHLGTAIPLMKLRQFQDLGHKVILLIGDFTAMSGDPDKTEARKRITRKEVLENCRKYKEQTGKILKFTGKNAAQYRFNSRWLSKLTFTDVVELASHVTVQRMLERDLFKRRIDDSKPLYIHEFLYPLMQGYDSVYMNVDGEIGGNDQTYNMLTGRDLMKAYKKKEKFVLTMKLLEDSTGKKMGKTEGNMVTLVDSPKEMFGKIMSWTDEMIVPAYELLTQVPMSEVRKCDELMREGRLNPRDAKAELASRIVTFFYNASSAKKAETGFIKTFAKKEDPGDIEKVNLTKKKMALIDFLAAYKLAASKSEARRLIEQGGVKVNHTRVSEWNVEIEFKSGDIVQVGKRRFVKIS